MNAEERKQLGEAVTAARKAKRYTQQQLADAAGVSLGTINNLERGERVPQAQNRRAIARALGVDVFGDMTAQATMDLWPEDVQAFVRALGGFLAKLDPETRAGYVAQWMFEIVNSKGDGGRSVNST